jgi:hypothetical protein
VKRVNDLRRSQKSIVIVGLILFALVLFVLQLWLFVTTLEEALAGHTRLSWATAFFSVALVAVDVWMLDGIFQLDKAP